MPLPRVFFDLSVADQPLGRVVFELFADVVPKTAENFRALCTGEKSTPGKSLAYASSPIHRVIDGFMIQGGDFTKRNGTGGESIYGGTFKDERLEGDGTAVDRKGLLVMANRGPNTNGSQFFVTLAPAGHLTGKHVVFGRVVFGMEHIDAIGKLATDERDRPLSPVIISRAGELELRAAPAPARARSPSPSRASSRSRSRSRSRSISSDSEDERRRRRRERRERKEREREERRAERKRRKERRRRHDSDSEDDSDGDGEPKRSSRSKSPRRRSRRSRSPSETLSELDARLEREEKERLEKERLEKLKEMKAQIERERQAVKDAGGVVYKGRGTMRYRDPETRGSGMPTNFSARGHDTRPRYRRDRGDRERDDAGRWERGGDARPAFERERGKDMDRWDHGGWSSRDEHRDERRDGERERGGERGDRGRDGRDRDGGRGRERDEGEGRPLADRLGGGLDYRDEAERERGPDPRMDPGRAARANAWRSAARRSVSPAPRRSPLPPRHSPSPVMRRSPSRERGRTPGTPSSDMVMDD